MQTKDRQLCTVLFRETARHALTRVIGPGKTVMTIDRTDGSIDARVHAPHKIALLVRTGSEEGLDATALLAGTELEPADLDNPEVRTSARQFVLACRNALELGASPELPFRMGARVRLSSYGLYGYAMLTSATVRDALRFSVRYHGLTTTTRSRNVQIAWPSASCSFMRQVVVVRPW